MLRYAILLTFTLLSVLPIVAQRPEGEPLNRTENGVRQGWWQIEGRNGKIDEGAYVNGKKHGEWVTTSADGVVRSRVTYDNGVPRGKATYYFPDGKVMETGYWNVDHWDGEYGRFYENGNKSCSFNYDNKGRRTGKQTYFHENGTLMYDGVWEAGKINGPLSIYNDEGRKVMERNYDASGKYQGSQDLTPEVGEVEGKSNREFHGSGNFTIYDSSGRRDMTGQFKDGVLINGEKFIYNSAGKLERIDKYSGGKKVGSSKP